MGVWFNSIVSVLIISLISLIGILTLAIKIKNLQKILLFLVSFSAGALFAGAFLHLMPESVEKYGFSLNISLFFLAGIILFFMLEKFMHWRHCHVPTSKFHPHPLASMNLIGDAFHNLIDGLIIGGAYLASFQLGIATTIAVIFHEIPQEIGDFGVLLHAGMKRTKALMLNFAVSLTAILGVIVSLLLADSVQNYLMFLLPFTAGGFVYIAGSDLIPELHKECGTQKSVLQFLSLILGIVVMLGLRIVF